MMGNTSVAYLKSKGAGVMKTCPTCPYSTLDSANFKRHLLVHTGERRFKCHICNKCFIQKAHLQKHSLRHAQLQNY